MNREKIFKKFGRKEYQVDDDTFIMGIHYLLGDHIAKRFKGYDTILDTCCGAGFMSITLAKYANRVIAVEVDHKYLNQAENNAKIAGVSSKVNNIFFKGVSRAGLLPRPRPKESTPLET